ncbi:MAG: ferredoxin [Bacilli bacterium]|nr:ferredoxin [Bacilli bacterium]
MRVQVDKNLCIGCGACQAIEPSIFELEDDGLAKAKDEEINDKIKENVMDALEGCPTSAISELKVSEENEK